MSPMSSRQAFGLLPQFMPKQERVRFALILLFAVIMAIAELSIAGLVAIMAAAFSSPDAVMQLKQVQWLYKVTGLESMQDPRLLVLGLLGSVVLNVVLKNLLATVQQWHITALAVGVSNRVQLQLLTFYLRAPYLWIVECGTPKLLFQMGMGNHLLTLLGSAMQIFSSLLMMITMFAGLLVASLLPSLLFFSCLGIGGTLIVIRVRCAMDRMAQSQHHFDYDLNFLRQTGVHAIKELRMYGRGGRLISKFSTLLDQLLHVQKRLQAFQRIPVSLLEIWGFSTLCAVLTFLIFVQNATMAHITGIIGFLAAAAWRCLPVTNRLIEQLTLVRAAFPYLCTLSEVLQTEKNFSSHLALPFDEEPDSVSFLQDVRLENVSFYYKDTALPALKNISLQIKSGEITGIIGLSGAGKSTLVNLLTGLFLASSGRVTIDGKPLNRETVPSWLHKIGYVTQSPFLLDASLAENIAFSRWGESIDRNRVLECCTMAALDFLGQLDNGIDTMIGERGVRLSGGQAQRVAIARALYSEPELIIFDEATSSLDIKNEKAIHETIMTLRRKATMVIIAHRLTTVEGCDSIVWLDNGTIVEQGSAFEVLEHYKTTLMQSTEHGKSV